MDKMFQKIEELVTKYPSHVKTYRPASLDSIIKTERILGYEINSSLKQIYEYSDGISFLDYALLSVGNEKMATLTSCNIDSRAVKKADGIQFIKTSGEECFILDLDGRTVRYSLADGDPGTVVAGSVDIFFEEFLDKIDHLMTFLGPKDLVRYFTDDDIREQFRWV